MLRHAPQGGMKRRSVEMSNKKKGISLAQIFVLVGALVAMGLVILLSLLFHDPANATCCPWCFGACPWCFLIVDLVVIAIFAAVLLVLLMAKVVEAVADVVTEAVAGDENRDNRENAEKKHRAQREWNIPKQKKHRERAHGHLLRHAKQYDATVSLQQLMTAFEDGATVNIETLKAMGMIPPKADGYKVLVADNEKMDRALEIYATSFSEQAKQAIVAAGGKAVKVYH